MPSKNNSREMVKSILEFWNYFRDLAAEGLVEFPHTTFLISLNFLMRCHCLDYASIQGNLSFKHKKKLSSPLNNKMFPCKMNFPGTISSEYWGKINFFCKTILIIHELIYHPHSQKFNNEPMNNSNNCWEISDDLALFKD